MTTKRLYEIRLSTLYVRRDIAVCLNKEAEKQGKSLSEIRRQALKEYLQKRETENVPGR